MKLMAARVSFAGAVLLVVGCASSGVSGGASSKPRSVDSAGGRGDARAEAEDAKEASTEKVAGRPVGRGPSLDRQGCDPSGKATVVTQKGADGQVNRWRYFAVVRRGAGTARVLKCEASDNNGDGYVDARYFYDDRGRLTLEQRDLDFDGRAEVVADYSHFTYGHLKHASDLN
jgi:hypothetical protein